MTERLVIDRARVLKVALMYYVWYDDSNPDVGMGRSLSMMFEDMVKEMGGDVRVIPDWVCDDVMNYVKNKEWENEDNEY
jgi:hypothetical protein